MTSLLFAMLACGSSDTPPAPPTPAAQPPKPAAPAVPPPPPAEPAAVGEEAAKPDGEAAAATGGAGDAKAGEAIYTQYCAACHQADGGGMNGMLAADFKKEKERLARPDDELLKSIAEGVTGKTGVMPPWKGQLNDQQMKDVLAYIRATFGS